MTADYIQKPLLLVGSYPFTAYPFHVDFQGRLHMGVLGNQLLNCADMHASQLGYDMRTLTSEGYSWVLSRLSIEMNRLPLMYEDYTVETWVESLYRLFTDRAFAVRSVGGEILGYARSVWALINTVTRKPLDLSTVRGGTFSALVCPERECPIAKPSRVKVGSSLPLVSLPVTYADLDINNHVNSIRYISHILNLFPASKFHSKIVGRFEIAYVAETYADDQMLFFHESQGDDVDVVEVRRQQGELVETVCRSRIEWKPLDSIIDGRKSTT